MKNVTLDPIEEREYASLREMGQRLHVPIPEAKWKLEVFLRGNLVQSYEARSHSWTRNAYNILFSNLAEVQVNSIAAFEGGKINIKTIGGTIEESTNFNLAVIKNCNTLDEGVIAAAGTVTNGIVVGSGVGAEDFESYTLETLIADGVGGGQMAYIQSNPHVITYDALTLTDTLIRFFNNNSGGNVDVKEVGLYGEVKPNNTFQCMLARDLLGATVTVPDTGQLKVTYTISLTYPS